MNKLLDKLITYFAFGFLCIFIGTQIDNSSYWIKKSKYLISVITSPRLYEKEKWNKNFQHVRIKSSIDEHFQDAYLYKTKSSKKKPLLVSLHNWRGDYTQFDSLSILSKSQDINYIHPNFRGPNTNPEACCSNRALRDIDDAISYAINNANVDTSKIYVIGASGGGYACLSTFMKSKHSIAKFSAWVPITDLKRWYTECKILGNDFSKDILNCTSSTGSLDPAIAEERSPIYWNTPIEKLKNTRISIYTGVNDGINGSVPITHSINFYNKLLKDTKVIDSSKYVSRQERENLLKLRKALGNYGTISNREVCLEKRSQNIRLVVFDGNHEMLTNYAFNNLIN